MPLAARLGSYRLTCVFELNVERQPFADGRLAYCRAV